jgi:hypothetical protein
MKQLQPDWWGYVNFRTVVSSMSFTTNILQSKSWYLSLGSQNFDTIYRTSSQSIQGRTSSQHCSAVKR